MIDLSTLTRMDIGVGIGGLLLGALLVWAFPSLWRVARAGVTAVIVRLTSVEYRLSADVSDLESYLTSRISQVEADVANLRASVASQTVALSRLVPTPAPAVPVPAPVPVPEAANIVRSVT